MGWLTAFLVGQITRFKHNPPVRDPSCTGNQRHSTCKFEATNLPWGAGFLHQVILFPSD